jgi:hypothetical protein
MPTRNYTRHKLTLGETEAAVQSPDLASATPNLSTLIGPISPVEVRKSNLCQERIDGKVPKVTFRDTEQFQGVCIRRNETPAAVRDNDCFRGTSQQIAQIILSGQTHFPHPPRFLGDGPSQGDDCVLRLLKFPCYESRYAGNPPSEWANFRFYGHDCGMKPCSQLPQIILRLAP